MRRDRRYGGTAARWLGAAFAGLALRRLVRASRWMDFRDRGVVILGGSRGLGLVLAQELAREQARVAIVARSADERARARDQIAAQTGNPPLLLAADLTDRAAVQAAVAQLAAQLGRLDVLVNNAGVIEVGPAAHMRTEDFERALSLHFWAPLFAMEAAIPLMRRHGGGRIVNVSSIGGRVALPHLLPYTASKHALAGLSDALGAELSRDGIRVTTVAPGLMRTGSHLSAAIKGRHEAEFAWFAIADSLPGLSMDVTRAARKIVDACRHGDRRCTIGIPAKLAILASAVAPELFADLMAATNRLLPKPRPDRSSETRSGWQSRSRRVPTWLTRRADRSAVQHNGLGGHSAEEALSGRSS